MRVRGDISRRIDLPWRYIRLVDAVCTQLVMTAYAASSCGATGALAESPHRTMVAARPRRRHGAYARSSTPLGCRLKAATCWCRGRRYTAQPIGTAMVTSSHRHAMHAFIVSTVDQHVHVSRRSHDLATQRCIQHDRSRNLPRALATCLPERVYDTVSLHATSCHAESKAVRPSAAGRGSAPPRETTPQSVRPGHGAAIKYNN